MRRKPERAKMQVYVNVEYYWKMKILAAKKKKTLTDAVDEAFRDYLIKNGEEKDNG